MCLRIIVPALVAGLGVATPHVRCVRSCDWAEMQLYVLKKQSQLLDGSTSCVFSNVEDRLVSRAQSWLSEVAPTRETDSHVVEDSNATMAAFYGEEQRFDFRKDAMCECLVHKQPCWAYPAVGYEYGLTSDASAADMLGEPSAKKLRPWRSNASGIELARPAWWTQRAILGQDYCDPF